ncbi:MAG: SLC13 family permease [Myxococcota bacterium]
MKHDIIIVFFLLGISPFLFAWKKIPIALASLMITGILMLTGVLSPEDGFSGFSSSAVVTIASMFIISKAILFTGGLDYITDLFSFLGNFKKQKAIIFILLTIGVISAFINNTASVAIFIPVIISIGHKLKMSPSKLLMPLSFISILGGICTLIGTSTNILVNSVAVENGLSSLGMFEFSPMGLIFFGVGFLYIFTIGFKLFPDRREEGTDLTSDYSMKNFLTDVELKPAFKGVGHRLNEEKLLGDLDLDILEVYPAGSQERSSKEIRDLQSGDILRIRGNAKDIARLVKREDLIVRPSHNWKDMDFTGGELSLVEVVIAPNSDLQNQNIDDINFVEKFGAIVLALRSRGELMQEDFKNIALSGGDSLLLYVKTERIEELKHHSSFVVVSEIGFKEYRSKRLPFALAILAGVIISSALGIVPISVATVTGSISLVLCGCLTMDEAVNAINWKVIFLLGGILPLGLAMEKSGAATLLSQWLLENLAQFGPRALLGGFFFLAMILTSLISNQATAALLAPIAINFANSIDANPKTFLITIAFAASLNFMTPVYQTNTLILGPGHYRYTDFLKVGIPLNLIMWVVAVIFIPFFWPL